MTKESRILAVLHDRLLLNQSHTIRLAKMDTTTAIQTLHRLMDLGLVERFTAQVCGRGRPAYLYRRVTTRREQAA